MVQSMRQHKENPGKTGFVVHASCVMEYTGVTQRSDAKRSELDPAWIESPK